MLLRRVAYLRSRGRGQSTASGVPLALSKETLDRIALETVQGGLYGNNAKIVETDTPSECFC